MIENIILNYIKDEECFITNQYDIYLISNYIYHSKRLQNFIKLNNLTINDFTSLISSSKIISSNEKRILYNEGESQYGFYILMKGSLLIKISKFSVPKNMDSFFKDEILQEYNLQNDSKITWLKKNEIEQNENKELPYKYLSDRKMTNISPYSSIFQQKHQERIKNSKKIKYISRTKDPYDEVYQINKEEIELFIYNLELNDCLFFGGVNIFNEYIRDSSQIHLTSAYTFNKNIYCDKNNVNLNTIILFISEDKIKELTKKIALLNKERTKFLLNKLKPLNVMRVENIRFFISTIKMIYINIEERKELINMKNVFYLVYHGSCWEKKKKEIIYDQGSFIGLNNLFFDEIQKDLNKTTLYSKGSNAILFKIDLNYLSENNKENMKYFLRDIFSSQYIARTLYINNIESYQNKKIKEKENAKENELKKCIILNPSSLLNIINKQFFNTSHKNSRRNEKYLNNIYFNKNASREIKASKNLIPQKKKKIRYFLKNNNNRNLKSKTSQRNFSELPSVKNLRNSEFSAINNNHYPINSISLNNKYNCSTDRIFFLNNKYNCSTDRINFKNNICDGKSHINIINDYSCKSCFLSRSSHSFNRQTKKNNNNKTKFYKNKLLGNIKAINIKESNLKDFHNEKTH